MVRRDVANISELRRGSEQIEPFVALIADDTASPPPTWFIHSNRGEGGGGGVYGENGMVGKHDEVFATQVT